MGAIYGLSDPTTGIVRYVGWSARPAHRYGQHCRASSVRRDKSPKGRWIAELAERGFKPTLLILESDPADWEASERHWIAKLNADGSNLLNAQPGGKIDGSIYKRSPRASRGGKWGKLHRARQILSAYPEKAARVEGAIQRLAKCMGGVSAAERYIEARLS